MTFLSDEFPIFWRRARGSNVWDADGNRYVDLTAGFAVAGAGHRNSRIVNALRRQIAHLLHGMGDVHPPEVKVRLLERLAELSPWGECRGILANSGSEAIEAALKTARLRSGRPGVIAFTGAYHGLTYGALSVTDRELFRVPFEDQLNPHVFRAPYPNAFRPPPGVEGNEAAGVTSLAIVESILAGPGGHAIGCVIVEPVQGRGGDVVPPPGFLAGLAGLCRERDLVLIFDEIYTGLGRTGRMFAFEHEDVVPDLLCIGKALSGALPIAACLGPSELMEVWPESTGEAKHTSTFLGNPLACAAAIASLGEIERLDLPVRARESGEYFRGLLTSLVSRHARVGEIRGRGLMIGMDLVRDPDSREPDPHLAEQLTLAALRRGWILLPGGPEGNVISFSPPLTISPDLIRRAVGMLEETLQELTF
ncbi:MAG: aspartate aminotransferase family protein [Gemmatimonadota bacterium]